MQEEKVSWFVTAYWSSSPSSNYGGRGPVEQKYRQQSIRVTLTVCRVLQVTLKIQKRILSKKETGMKMFLPSLNGIHVAVERAEVWNLEIWFRQLNEGNV